ncbi:hypothetical protein NBRC3188_0726 [Acetobacter pasteurianus NBRC 3188]|uniref:Protein L n=1 Tax=Acetobacter pasteurianus NBRC 3188 TaxID=1226663 RepID=A0A401WRS5_ACEPA|nr:hypothetical protein NBRC3188_0726 [Acetobacter pasteurianus NBRC 3188]
MALYKYSSFVTQSNDTGFDAIHSPGTPAPFAGIYKCAGCGHEIGTAEAHPLPPQNHHQHTVAQGNIRWRLAVYAQHN